MISPSAVHIDPDKCSGCGRCLRVCPDRTLALREGRAVVAGRDCIACGHCAAVCPESAVRVEAADTDLHFSTFAEERDWLPWGRYDLAGLVRLMRSRRSCRNYTPQPVSRAMLEDLVKIGATAPSGTNSQGWTFTILDRRDQVVALGGMVASFYRRLNKKAANPLLRFVARIFMQDALGRYYRRYYSSVDQGLREWDEGGGDRLFHNATAVILVGSRPWASCPAEDALLATQNMLLAAHAMGLGTCLIGFAVEAIKRNGAIKRALDIPAEETVYSVIALGYPAEAYQKVTGRKKILPRFPENLAG
ncbi:MAG: nitroreductase family protein [Deltaproteobacteria bacterium]|nr:nitroreductase family protein [Deltaproteobacteria bacterium]